MLDYLFVYEHKARELESVCLLKAALELRGYSCEIIQLHNFSFKTLNFRYFNKPKVIIVFALYNNKSFVGHVIDFVGYSKKVVNLQWEQIISDKYIKLGLHNPKGLAALATHICWGENSFKRLINNGVKNAVIAGAIHLDFLRNDFRDFYKTREELCDEFNIDGATAKTWKIMGENPRRVAEVKIEYDFSMCTLTDKEKTILRNLVKVSPVPLSLHDETKQTVSLKFS